MREIGIGLLGFGTVGIGVVKGLLDNGPALAARLGSLPVIRRIADVDLERDRGIAVDPALLTRDAASVVDDPAVDIVVELIGGTDAAKSLIIQALRAGKPVVTANKALLAECGEEIFSAAAGNDTDIYFGASVGGGIPIIRALREGLVANRINSILGILNGTCNFILTRMESQGLTFDEALAEAQARGYAEADPALDVDGYDTAHKAVILASLAYGVNVPMQAVHVEGIRGLSEIDISYGSDLGYRIKLLAVLKQHDSSFEVRVHPTMVHLDHMLASVAGVFNAVMVHGDLSGRTLYYGRGAGAEPTASTVIADIADIVRNISLGPSRRFAAVSGSSAQARIMEMGEVETRYYLRLSLLDKPGMFGRIASVLGRHDISIASVLQKEVSQGDYVPVIVVTHDARESDLSAALAEIDDMEVVGAGTVKFRIEE
jgi:homoserine dehydrogenase